MKSIGTNSKRIKRKINKINRKIKEINQNMSETHREGSVALVADTENTSRHVWSVCVLCVVCVSRCVGVVWNVSCVCVLCRVLRVIW